MDLVRIFIIDDFEAMLHDYEEEQEKNYEGRPRAKGSPNGRREGGCEEGDLSKPLPLLQPPLLY